MPIPLEAKRARNAAYQRAFRARERKILLDATRKELQQKEEELSQLEAHTNNPSYKMESTETVEIKTELEDENYEFCEMTEQQPNVSSRLEDTLDVQCETDADIEPKIVGETQAQTAIKSELDIEPTIVGETQKLYDIERLRMFGEVPFIIKRMELEELSISYHNAVQRVETILERLRRNQVPVSSCIAVRIAHHTPSSCLIILAILNHKCHFYCTESGMQSPAMRSQMCCLGIEYLIVNNKTPLGSGNFELLDTFIVYNEEYKLAKLMHIPTDPSAHAADTLPRNMCYTITTTGTTGLPKIIHVPYESIEPNIIGLSNKLNLSMADIIYLGTPCTFDPSVVELFLAMYNGATALVSHHLMRVSPKRVLGDLFPSCVTTPGITILQMTPSVFRQFGAKAIREQILNSSSALRVLLLGGEEFPSSAELATWMAPEVLHQKLICNIYGITEISCWSTMHILKSIHERVPLGSPIDDQTVLRVQPLPKKYSNSSVDCELWLGSATRRCYIPGVDNVAGKKSDNSGILYRATGDLVRRYPDGSIVYEGRANDFVKRAGNRISLGQITRKIENCLQSSNLVVCLWQQHTQKLICCIRSLEPKTIVQQRSQIFIILSKLMAAEQPDRFVYLQHFPYNAHGKLDKELLLKESTLLTHSAQDIIKNFLHGRLENVDVEQSETAPNKKKPRTKLLSGCSLSFRQAGGTSFNAITLSREIGLQMCLDDEQEHLFELLMDENVPLSEVFKFLDTAKLVAENTKLKPIEPIACPTVSPAANSSLVIKHNEKIAINCQINWRKNFNKCIDSPVAQIDGKYVCVGGHSKLLRTLSAVTGTELCTVKLSDRIECKVTFVNSNLAMVGCYDGFLYGFNPLTGSKLWNVDIGGMIKSQPCLSSDGNRVVVCSYADDYNVICLSMERQQLLWRIRIGKKAIFASPLELPKKQAVIICTLDGHYARVSLLDGSMQWLQRCKKPIFSSPVLLDSSAGIFACAEVAGSVHACDVKSGKILSTYAVNGDIFSSLVAEARPTYMGHSFLIFGCIDQYLYCLLCKTSAEPMASLKPHWRINLGGSIYATPSIISMDPHESLVFCCATNGEIMLTTLNNGRIQYSDQIHGELFSAPCYIKSLKRIYFGCRNNYLYCLSLHNHTEYIRLNQS